MKNTSHYTPASPGKSPARSSKKDDSVKSKVDYEQISQGQIQVEIHQSMGAVDDELQTNGGELEVANNIPVAEANQDEYEYGEYDEEEDEASAAKQASNGKLPVKLAEAVKPTTKIVEVPPS